MLALGIKYSSPGESDKIARKVRPLSYTVVGGLSSSRVIEVKSSVPIRSTALSRRRRLLLKRLVQKS